LFRAYLAPNGVDTNPCSLAAPCRLLPAALAAVLDGGEIWMLDSANYNSGPVDINKSVTILAVPGALGSVVAKNGNAINISTPGVKVALRNLVIVPVVGGGGAGGINMTAGASLEVENCLVANLPGNGISVGANAATVVVGDTTIRGNGGYGLYVADGAHATVTRARISGNAMGGVMVWGLLAGTTTADITDSTMDANMNGVMAYSINAAATVKVSLRDSQLVQNSQNGVMAQSESGALIDLAASNNVISNNGTNGIFANKTGVQVLASGNTVSDNGIGLASSAGGIFQSAGDNAVRNNGIDASGAISLSPGL
jgi:hypothetical protein